MKFVSGRFLGSGTPGHARAVVTIGGGWARIGSAFIWADWDRCLDCCCRHGIAIAASRACSHRSYSPLKRRSTAGLLPLLALAASYSISRCHANVDQPRRSSARMALPSIGRFDGTARTRRACAALSRLSKRTAEDACVVPLMCDIPSDSILDDRKPSSAY